MRLWVAAILLMAGCSQPSLPGATPPEPLGDPYRDQQWALDLLRAEAAWEHATGAGVVVALLDTGVDSSHPDLAGQLIFNLDADFVDPGSDNGPEDECFHGTATGGLIAAGRDNGIGIAGIAPGARLLPVRVTNDCRVDEVPQETVLTLAFLEMRVAQGIRYATDHGAHVISMSFVSGPWVPADSLPVNEAIAYAWSKGVVLVAGSGNNGLPACLAPAGNPQVLCVGATTRGDVAAEYSNNGGMHVMAPGGGNPQGTTPPGAAGPCADAILTLDSGLGRTCSPGEGYFAANGTSLATPLVAGVAALLVELGLSNVEVLERLRATTVDLGAPGLDATYGWGRVDALRAVTDDRSVRGITSL